MPLLLLLLLLLVLAGGGDDAVSVTSTVLVFLRNRGMRRRITRPVRDLPPPLLPPEEPTDPMFSSLDAECCIDGAGFSPSAITDAEEEPTDPRLSADALSLICETVRLALRLLLSGFCCMSEAPALNFSDEERAKSSFRVLC